MFVRLAHNWWTLPLRRTLALVFGLLILVIPRAGVLALGRHSHHLCDTSTHKNPSDPRISSRKGP